MEMAYEVLNNFLFLSIDLLPLQLDAIKGRGRVGSILASYSQYPRLGHLLS